MSIIGCTSDCVYQNDGYCTLEHAASGGEASENGCIHYVRKSGAKYRKENSNKNKMAWPNFSD